MFFKLGHFTIAHQHKATGTNINEERTTAQRRIYSIVVVFWKETAHSPCWRAINMAFKIYNLLNR